jgi:hypothetical protein
VEVNLDRPSHGTLIVMGGIDTNPMPDWYWFLKGERDFTEADGTKVIVDVTIQNAFLLDLPWHYKGPINLYTTWKEKKGDEDHGVHIWPHVELYFLTNDMAPVFKSGIPLEFLSLFTVPLKTVIEAKVSKNDWISWVVKRCHASKCHAIQYKDYLPGLGFEPIHRYRYDVWNGGHEFSGGTGGNQFDLDRWLRFRNDKTRYLTVNCYDQAYLVNLALNLGLPYHLIRLADDCAGAVKDTRLTTTVGIYLKGWGIAGDDGLRFGFIQKKDLVGWGDANNPFFGGVERNMVLDSNSPQRYNFANHKWVCISSINSANQVTTVAVDACAGPAARPDTVHNYLTSVIDVPACKEAIQKSSRNVDNGWSDEWNIDAVNIIEPVRAIGSIHEDGNLHLKTYYIKRFFETCRPDFKFEDPAVVVLTTGISIDALFRNITESVQQLYPDTSSFTTSIGYQSAISLNKSSLEYYIDDLDENDDEDTASVPLLTLSVSVLTTLGAAVSDAAVEFTRMERNIQEFYKAPDASHRYGDFNLMSTGVTKQALLIYRNVVLDLQGRDDSKFDEIVQAIDKFMANYKDIPLPAKIEPSVVNVQVPSTLPIGKDFVVKVTVRLLR